MKQKKPAIRVRASEVEFVVEQLRKLAGLRASMGDAKEAHSLKIQAQILEGRLYGRKI